MSNLAKLKKQAAEFEQKKQFDKALAKYIQILDSLGEHPDEADVALFNRVGDLLLRQGSVGEATDYYERAVDLYTDGGFFNNAIALCNKILRNAPGRTSIYYKLGRISAKKGFTNDAKANFLEYADRMQKAGNLEEAFRALKEFADLCPDQDDIRLMLADQLVQKDRRTEAIEQLQVLYQKFEVEGRTKEARATADRMRAIDPEVSPRRSGSVPTPKSSDLVFLDLSYDGPASKSSRDAERGAASKERDRKEGARSGEAPTRERDTGDAEPEHADEVAAHEDMPDIVGGDLDILESPEVMLDDVASGADEDVAPAAEHDTLAIDGLVHGAGMGAADAGAVIEEVEGFQQHVFDPPSSVDEPVSSLPDLEPTMFGDPGDASLHAAELAEESDDADALQRADLPPADLDFDLGTGAGLGGDVGAGRGADPSSAYGAAPDDEMLQHLAEHDVPPISRDVSAETADEASGDEDLALTGELPMLGLDAGLNGDDDGDLDAALGTDAAGHDTSAPRAPAQHNVISDDLLAIDDSDDLLGIEALEEPPAPRPRRAVQPPRPSRERWEELRDAIVSSPQSWPLYRELGEALLEAGQREAGMEALETAMSGFARADDFSGAREVVDEIIRLEPNSVHHHQKRVEFAFRCNDRARLVDAYLALADCLFRTGEGEKSRAVYERVLELAPTDVRARRVLAEFAAADTLGEEDDAAAGTLTFLDPLPQEAPPAAHATGVGAAGAGDARARAVPSAGDDHHDAPAGDAFVNLSDWLREEETPRSTRMVVDVAEPAQREQVDFAEMLSMFKAGVAANVDEGDFQSHYDLGVAYKEMGLLDEAIAEFQKALRGTEHRIRTYEALGQCFVEKGQYQIAITILTRALHDRDQPDDALVGVLYLLGAASEALGQWADARAYYERVFALDIQFGDVGDRLAAMERKLA
ncbi:MAG TPA: tetratricopeptide repeat protein [Gemmatimonadaceae bacterium]|nr:tetratricopeptide repeat protein [Gemmatimonadaceae bacterium]